MRVRTYKNKSQSTVVQVGYDHGKSFKTVKHIGSAKTEIELQKLLSKAHEFLNKDRNPLFRETNQVKLVQANQFKPMGYTSSYAYQILSSYYDQIFGLNNSYLKNLSLIRLIKPSSKLEAIELLRDHFQIHYSKSDLHRKLSEILSLEDQIFSKTIEFAKQKLDFKFQFVFYDVTTLYFETHLRDENEETNPETNSNLETPPEIRKPGFSKDGKPDLPQILIGLVVDQNGFPIYYQTFPGNKFEGHTILPVILDFKTKFGIKELTIVADSGMLSKDNLTQIQQAGLFYIVGGRIKQETTSLLEVINQELKQSDKAITSKTINGVRQIYQYSKTRANKDRYDLKKSLNKAKEILENPAKAKKKLRFIRVKNNQVNLNQIQIKKAELAIGIKSYTTNNLSLEPVKVIQTYHSLWKVEKAFRMSKYDLQARPVFHRKQDSIKAHLLIVFTALAIAKVIELEKGISIKKYIKEIMKVLEFRLQDELTGEIHTFITSPKG